jgi:ketosteroid isomerase-like protein
LKPIGSRFQNRQKRAQTYTQEFEMTEAAMAQSNAALIKSGYDAFARGDLQGAFAVFAEDILWHVPGRGAISGDYRGTPK